MKGKLITIMAAMLFAAALTAAAGSSWTGWISDSQCGAKAAHAGARECTIKCVKEHGAKYVFVNDSDKKVYEVSDQKIVADHAGHHVTVEGTVKGDTLDVTSIKMVP
jgi:hypothetical protein